MDTIFIADVHLSGERPDKLNLLQQLLRGPGMQANAVYILGDLFENFWLGNDDTQSPNPFILSELRNYTESGKRLFIIRGNRDLMLDRGIEKLTGATLLPDLSVITLDGKEVLLTHGDLLCSKDIKYQRFRKVMDSGPIRWIFLHLPYSMRLYLVNALSPAFKQSTMSKKPEIMDVDPVTVINTMREHGVDELIHGHTHRPATHELVVKDKPARRIVLGDWYEDERILVCRDSERKLISVQDYLNEFNS